VAEERIPANFFYKEGAAKPIVFCQHGFTGIKESMLSTCLRLADAGFFAVAIDAVKHGERVDPNLLANLRENFAPFFEILLGTVKDVGKVIEHLEDNVNADVERVGMMGVSMGGIITLLTAAVNQKVKAIASVIGGANFPVLLEKSAINKMGLPMGPLEKLGSSAIEFVKKHDPINNVDRFRTMPVLLLNGEQDDLVPLECASSLYNALKPFYGVAQDRLKLKVYPKTGHEYKPEMETETVEWFKKHLLEQTGRKPTN